MPPAVEKAMPRFRASEIRAHTRYLSSDLLEGRGPGTRGDDLAMQYIAARFEGMGLKPGAADGTYFQKVPLIGVTTDPQRTSVAFEKNGEQTKLTYLDDYVGSDQTQAQSTTLDSDLIFVGHGVVAPEYKWDDYKGVDVRGKTIVMLVDDPPASSAEPELFKGKTRTYYGRWTYKYEMATSLGAKGAILIHTDEAAGYPWTVVRNSWGRERAYVKVTPGAPALSVAGWITAPVAAKLMSMAGLDLENVVRQAHSRDFHPIPLNVRLVGSINNNIRGIDTANVVAKLEGSDPKLRDEAVLYTAHHDHLGIGTPKNGDSIYNGAIDNATGCAVLLELARVWADTQPRPKRSIVFAAVAAEEQGLLGSEYYGQHPTVPAGKVALNLNFDSIDEFGKVSNVTMLGADRTTFYPTALRVTKAMGIRIDPDLHPEQGSYYRSDHFSLAKVGIPSFSIDPGDQYAGKPKDWGSRQFIDYKENRYHQPSDQFEESWDFSEGVQISQLGFWLGWEAASSRELPSWKKGDEFLSARERSLRDAGK